MSISPKKIFRSVIYPKDVGIITGRSARGCRSILNKIKKALGKTKRQFITVKEFCAFYGFEEDYIKEFL
jgi:hypothetical protein